MKTYERPPLILTHNSPEDIIGPRNMDLFTRHMRICRRSTNGGEFPDKALSKEIGPADRQAIADALKELRAHGYYPGRIDDRGQVVWHAALKSEGQELMENGLAELQRIPIDELQRMARGGYLQTVRRDDRQQVSKEFVDLVGATRPDYT